MVVEADESDGSFLRYRPTVAVATNVEPEHLEHYGGDFGRVVEAFARYLGAVPDGGLAVLGIDNPVLADLAQGLRSPWIGYGLSPKARLTARAVEAGPEGTRFVAVLDGQPVAEVRLALPGLHNVQNALAAMAAAHHVGIDWQAAGAQLARFQNARRRFQVLWPGPVRVVDDYAHHPTEIRSTIAAARQVTRGRVLVAFQPQRYSRTQRLWEAFPPAFAEADEVFLTEIYAPPGERPIPGLSGAKLAEAVAAHKPGRVHFVPDLMALVPAIRARARADDTVCTMGAGDIWRVGEALAAAYRAAGAGDSGSSA
jgi:UDP-N-acetylmuramate--alanine ligase